LFASVIAAPQVAGCSGVNRRRGLGRITLCTGNVLRNASSVGGGRTNGKRTVVLAPSDVRGIVERVCARQDVLDACVRRDLGTVITVLNAHGLTQGQIAELTGILQGRLSEYARRKRTPKASTTFEAFADGLGMPLAARRALRLAAEPSGSAGVSLAHSRQAPDLKAGLEYPGTPAQAAGNVSMLWRADLAGQGVLERGLVNSAAWSDASLRWLVGPAGGPGYWRGVAGRRPGGDG
jgi:transcriptional regulator with XRE-family HTH domain